MNKMASKKRLEETMFNCETSLERADGSVSYASCLILDSTRLPRLREELIAP